jgi:hypothetical protein
MRNMERARNALDQELAALDETAVDWPRGTTPASSCSAKAGTTSWSRT